MVAPLPRPLAARETEAVCRAKQLGVRVTVVTSGVHYITASQSRPDVVHELVRTADGFRCSCEGYTYTGMCRHLGALARRAMREGWTRPFRVARRLAA